MGIIGKLIITVFALSIGFCVSFAVTVAVCIKYKKLPKENADKTLKEKFDGKEVSG